MTLCVLLVVDAVERNTFLSLSSRTGIQAGTAMRILLQVIATFMLVVADRTGVCHDYH